MLSPVEELDLFPAVLTFGHGVQRLDKSQRREDRVQATYTTISTVARALPTHTAHRSLILLTYQNI